LHGRGPPVKLPTLSIAARLYAIFALMAATTVALSVYAVSNARFHAALTEEFESANAGSWNVERGIYMSADVADAASARNDRNPSQRQRDGAASVTGPISDITSVTEAVAAGDAAITIPFTDRRDEIGALARSIGIFQTAMRKNVELNRTVLNDADLRQQHMANEIAHLSSEVEATLAELGRISDEMLAASTQLGSAADNASAKTARAEEPSSEASANVRDIASAR
jgi:methyl-accepting chemotaxis protein